MAGAQCEDLFVSAGASVGAGGELSLRLGLIEPELRTIDLGLGGVIQRLLPEVFPPLGPRYETLSLKGSKDAFRHDQRCQPPKVERLRRSERTGAR